MKPLEILLALPQWSRKKPSEIVDSPAFALPCRLGNANEVLRFGAMQTPSSDLLLLAVHFGETPCVLGIADSPRFAQLHKLWAVRAEVPDPVLLALVEQECAPLLQALENALRRMLKIDGLESAPSADDRTLFATLGDIAFSISRAPFIDETFGILRNIDLAHESVRAISLPAQLERAAFAVPPGDLASLAPGDYILTPEIGTISPRLIVDGRFVADDTGVAPFESDSRARLRDAEGLSITLGELFDWCSAPHAPANRPVKDLKLLAPSGKLIANGTFGKLAGANAFIVQ